MSTKQLLVGFLEYVDLQVCTQGQDRANICDAFDETDIRGQWKDKLYADKNSYFHFSVWHFVLVCAQGRINLSCVNVFDKK